MTDRSVYHPGLLFFFRYIVATLAGMTIELSTLGN